MSGTAYSMSAQDQELLQAQVLASLSTRREPAPGANPSDPAARQHAGSVVPPFLAKLNDILGDAQYRHLISWSADGTRIVLHKLDDFSETVLPKFFKHNKFSSFLRQLNLYVSGD